MEISVALSMGAAVAAYLGREVLTNVNRAQRLRVIGQSFESLSGQLTDFGPENGPHRRLIAAVRLRRFFDIDGEYALQTLWRRSCPYEKDALSVISALLKSDIGNEDHALQKALADGLAYASSLVGVDLQCADLTKAFLGSKADPQGSSQVKRRSFLSFLARRSQTATAIDLRKLDLYGAKLDGASFKGAICAGALFVDCQARNAMFDSADLTGANFKRSQLDGAHFSQAKLSKCIFQSAIASNSKFVEADLTGADFSQATLTGANFKNALLIGATFIKAKDIPSEISNRLDENGVYR